MRIPAPRGDLVAVGRETLSLFEEGDLVVHGQRHDLAPLIDRALAGTRTVSPDEQVALRAQVVPRFPETRLTVANETTFEGAGHLRALGHSRVLALNFANALRPGGGFLGGARAQEEDLCRCSGLYPTLCADLQMYEANADQGGAMYTDHLIYSPDVPVIRREDLAFTAPWPCTVVTSPAPFALQLQRFSPSRMAELPATFARRLDGVLAVAAAEGHEALVLGAWGCGAFGNDPRMVAGVFKAALDGPWAGVFAEVRFSVFDPDGRNGNFAVFDAILA